MAKGEADLAVTRCAHPTTRGWSTYTVLGFLGYGMSSLLAAILFVAWDLPLVDRVITAFTPPLAFLVVVKITHAVVGVERIVFFQTAATGIVLTGLVDLAAGTQASRAVDIATMGIGTFLVFGRLGCFAVACCHGRPARFGVIYGDEHVRVGFTPRWRGRRLWPTQLVESATSLSLVIAGLAIGWSTPGLPAVIYIASYALVRFALELVRGDTARPHRRGLSEAQWTAPATMIVCAVWWPSIATFAIAVILVGAAIALAVTRHRREIYAAPHLVELDTACATAVRGDKAETSLGVSVSRHVLPDGRVDWILSSTRSDWSLEMAGRIAELLWQRAEIVPGRTAGIVHVIVAADAR